MPTSRKVAGVLGALPLRLDDDASSPQALQAVRTCAETSCLQLLVDQVIRLCVAVPAVFACLLYLDAPAVIQALHGTANFPHTCHAFP